jgi:hypothetical protein
VLHALSISSSLICSFQYSSERKLWSLSLWNFLQSIISPLLGSYVLLSTLFLKPPVYTVFP